MTDLEKALGLHVDPIDAEVREMRRLAAVSHLHDGARDVAIKQIAKVVAAIWRRMKAENDDGR